MPPTTPPGYEFPNLVSAVNEVEDALTRLKTSTAKIRRLEHGLKQLEDMRKTAIHDFEERQKTDDPLVDLDPLTSALEFLDGKVRAFVIQRDALGMFADEKHEETLDSIQKPSDSPFLLLKQAAAYARCSETSVYDAVKDGSLKAAKVGNSYRFTKDELDRWLWGDRS